MSLYDRKNVTIKNVYLRDDKCHIELLVNDNEVSFYAFKTPNYDDEGNYEYSTLSFSDKPLGEQLECYYQELTYINPEAQLKLREIIGSVLSGEIRYEFPIVFTKSGKIVAS